jgi:hypothetical protein
MYKDKEGELHSFDENQSLEAWGGYRTESDHKGRKIIGHAYDPETLNPYGRGPAFVQAIYKDEFAKYAGHEWVSNWDINSNSDMDMESHWYQFLPRTLNNAITGVGEMFAGAAAGFSNLVGAEQTAINIQNTMLAGLKSGEVSQSLETQEAGMFGTWDATLGLIGDVVIQLATGRAFGAGASLASKAMGFGRAAQMKSARYGSIWAMTLYGGKDMYETGLAAGFTGQQAGALYAVNLIGLYGVNRVFNWMDDAYAAKRVLNKNSQILKANQGYFKGAVEEAAEITAKEGAEAGRLAFAKKIVKFNKNAMTKIHDYLVKTPVGSGVKGYAAVMSKEGVEEMAEFFTEEVVKQSADFMRYSGIWKEGNGHFKSMFEEGYWEEFGAGMMQSAAGGIIGGAAGKAIFMRGGQTKQEKSSLINVILSGDGDSFLGQLDEWHQQGLMGDMNLSTEWDAEAGAYKPLSAASEGAQSMNDANRQLLQHEYNYLKTIIDKFGGNRAFTEMLEQNEGFKEHLESMSIVDDVKDLTSRYVGLVTENDAEEEEVVPAKDDISDVDKKKHYVSESKKNGLSLAVAEKIGELKKELDDIQSGKATEKYFLQALSKHTIFDSESIEKAYAKYGKSFLFDLMDASAESAGQNEVIAEKIAKTMESNDKIVNELEPDLSNIDDLLEVFNSGENTYLSDKSQKKIIDLYENYKIDKNKKAELEERLETHLTQDGTYEPSTIIKSEYYRGISKPRNLFKAEISEIESKFGVTLTTGVATGNYKVEGEGDIKGAQEAIEELANDMKEKFPAFASAYFNSRVENQLKNLETMKDLDNVRLETVEGLVERLSDFSGMNDSLEGLIESNLDLKLREAKSPEDAAKLGEKVGKIIAESDLREYDEDASYGNLKSVRNVRDAVLDIEGNFGKLKEMAQVINGENFKSEAEVAYDPTNVDYIRRGFGKTADGITDSNDLNDAAGNIAQQIADNELDGEGSSTFSNTEEAQDVLNQIRGRRAQIQFLSDITKLERDGATMLTGANTMSLSSLRYRQTRINEEPGTSSADILDQAIKDSEKTGFAQVFHRTAINPLRFAQLSMQDPSTLTVEERAELAEAQKTLTNLAIIDAELAEIESYMEEAVNLAERNQDSKNIENIHKESLAKSLALEFNAMHDLLTAGDVLNAPGWEFFVEANGMFNPANTGDAALEESFQALQKVKRKLFLLNPDTKASMLDKYMALSETLSQSAEDTKNMLNSVVISLEFSEDDFYSRYKTLVELDALEGIATTDQERVALGVAAHMNSNAGNVIMNKRNLNGDNPMHDSMFVSGLQGTGKSTFVLGVGLKIGLGVQAKKYGKSKAKVLLASNSEDQVNVLHNTMKDYQMTGMVQYDGASNGVVSTLDNEGVKRPLRLLELLRENKELDDVSTIVYDEATYIEFRGNTTDAVEGKSDLMKMVYYVDLINKKRDINKQPKLKLVFTGDENQNGFTNTSGEDAHIGSVKTDMFASPQLTYSHRTRISAVTGFINDNLISADSRKKIELSFNVGDIGDLESSYGFIKGRGEKLLGGVKFDTNFDAVSDDDGPEGIITNIRGQIDLDHTFSTVVILPEGREVDSASALGKLMKESPYNFKIHTHDSVQGSEFDYVIGVMTAADIGNSKEHLGGKAILERGAAKKIATTIGRARYFSNIINETERKFTSVEVDTITLPSEKLDTNIKDNIRALKLKMIDAAPVEVEMSEIEETEEEIRKVTEDRKLESEKAEKKVSDFNSRALGIEPVTV